ncbi:MAG: Basic proline-rich protein [Myxococcaceae bacterium]|nr:Basic proline-rich protein [Myxococcaceae bacterium]
MSPAGSVTAQELVRALDRNGATLPAEIGTFIVLEACETMLQGDSRELESLAHVRISEQGAVSLGGASCDDETAARGLHRSLAKLLLAAGPTLPPALARLAEQGPRGAEFSLRALHDELEAALVPLNRKASRRVLSRFAREAAHPVLDPDDVDAALSSLIGASSAPDNDAPGKARSLRSSAPSAHEGDPLDGLDLGGEESHYLEAAGRPSRDRISEESLRAVRPSRPSFAPPAPQLAPAARARDQSRESSHDPMRSLRALTSERPEGDPSSATSRKLFLGFALVALAIIGVTMALSLRNERLAAAETPSLPVDGELAGPVVGGDLSVHVSLPNAQVLRFVGRAPTTVANLPVGVAHEFVATAEGYRPSRALVPASADWEATAEGARYELAMQLAPSGNEEPPASRSASDQALELGPSKLDAQVGTVPQRLGSVRVVATPHGARIYQLIGFSPDVKVQDVPLTDSQELLIYREGYVPVVRVLQGADFKAQAGRRVAAVDVELSKRR